MLALRLSRLKQCVAKSPSLRILLQILTAPRSEAPFHAIVPRTLRCPPSTSCIPPHGHRLFMINHIAQVCQGALELPAIDSLGGFAGVFEGDAEVGAVSAGGFAWLD